MAYIQHQGENTADWLRRLIAIDAPVDIRADVRGILANETAQAGTVNAVLFSSFGYFLVILSWC